MSDYGEFEAEAPQGKLQGLVSKVTGLSTRNKLVLAAVVVAAVCAVGYYYLGWFNNGNSTTESFSTYTSLENLKSASNPVYVFLSMRGCGWCNKAASEGGSWHNLQQEASNGKLKVGDQLVDLVKANSGENPGLFNEVSEAVKARGYPTFVLCNGGKFTVFNDKRNAEAMKKFIGNNL